MQKNARLSKLRAEESAEHDVNVLKRHWYSHKYNSDAYGCVRCQEYWLVLRCIDMYARKRNWR